MQLSVIILNYNVRFFLEQCVESVQNALNGIKGEIIVVDNDSADDSCAMIRSRFPDVILIENKANLGFPKGNNIGVDRARGKYICILNPDTVVPEDAFVKLMAFAENTNDLGIVGPRLIDGRGRFLPESKRGTPTPFVAITKIAGLYKIFPKYGLLTKYYAGHLKENQIGQTDILVGAFMLMQRQLYIDIGGFDENCFMYSDDIDLSYSVLKSGKKNYYFPEVTVIHYKGESTVKDKAYVKRFSEAMNFFYKKHFQPSAAFNMLMKIGSHLFAIAKSRKKQHIAGISDYYVLSSDAKLTDLLQPTLQKTVCLTSISDMNQTHVKPAAEFIFDTRDHTYQQIIDAMSKLSALDPTFKILHHESGFMIGSNSSDDRGEVLQLK